MKFETLAVYSKWLEKNFSPEVMIPLLPVIIRLDGNNFSKWTKNLNKPFDEGFSNLMIETTKFLVKETNSIVGYTQSDEITLILYSDDINKSIYNDGKKQKILSKLTSNCSNFFNSQVSKYLPSQNNIANFDCRIYQVPTLSDACSQLLWRENDATKNSISMLAQNMFSYNDLLKLNGNQLQNKMLTERGINWNDLPVKFKRGTYIRRTKKYIEFTPDELSRLPILHEARLNPQLKIERNVIEQIELPIFSKITNKVEVIFNGENPIINR